MESKPGPTRVKFEDANDVAIIHPDVLVLLQALEGALCSRRTRRLVFTAALEWRPIHVRLLGCLWDDFRNKASE